MEITCLLESVPLFVKLTNIRHKEKHRKGKPINCTPVLQLFCEYDQQITDTSEGLTRKRKTTQLKLFLGAIAVNTIINLNSSLITDNSGKWCKLRKLSIYKIHVHVYTVYPALHCTCSCLFINGLCKCLMKFSLDWPCTVPFTQKSSIYQKTLGQV